MMIFILFFKSLIVKASLKEYIRNDLDFKIIEEKDYITKPKESGYRGYHFLVGVPVYTLNGEVTYTNLSNGHFGIFTTT